MIAISYQQKLRQKVRGNYTNEVNQAVSRCFFSAFSENLGLGDINHFYINYQLSIMHVSTTARFNEFHFKFKKQNS